MTNNFGVVLFYYLNHFKILKFLSFKGNATNKNFQFYFSLFLINRKIKIPNLNKIKIKTRLLNLNSKNYIINQLLLVKIAEYLYFIREFCVMSEGQGSIYP